MRPAGSICKEDPIREVKFLSRHVIRVVNPVTIYQNFRRLGTVVCLNEAETRMGCGQKTVGRQTDVKRHAEEGHYDQSTVNKRPGLTRNQTARAVVVCLILYITTFLALYLPKE